MKVPDDATLTKPYFTRPDQEQPYYNLVDERYRNLSFAPYPLAATLRVTYRGTEVTSKRLFEPISGLRVSASRATAAGRSGDIRQCFSRFGSCSIEREVFPILL